MQCKRSLLCFGPLLLACAIAAGCQSNHAASSQDHATQEFMRLHGNGDNIKTLVQKRAIHAGQSVQAALKDCSPFRVTEHEPYTFIEAYPDGFTGLTLTAINGKLVTAYEWSCTYALKHFNTLNERETDESESIYESIIQERIAATRAALEGQ